MNFFPQPCLALPQSPKLRAKQGHAESTTFAKDFSDQKNNPFRPLRPLRAKARPGNAGREQSVPQSPIPNPQSSFPSLPRTCPDPVGALVGALQPLRATARPGNAGREQSVSQSPITNLPFRPWRPWREQSGFSLTEVVIAMGVAAVAFTSIIALFPLGLNMSKESYEETQAALLAQTILADVKDQQTGSKNKRYKAADGSPYSYKLIQIAGNVDPQMVTTNYLGIDLRLLTEQNVYLAYDAQPRKDTDTNSQPIMLRPSAGTTNIAGWYDGSKPSNGLAAVAKVTFVPTFSITTLAATTGVLRVDISIETPGSAKPENRTVRLYTGAIVP